MLQALSEAIAKSPGASDFVACEASAGEKWLREAGDARVRNLYSDFIKKFKHRCLREVRYIPPELAYHNGLAVHATYSFSVRPAGRSVGR